MKPLLLLLCCASAWGQTGASQVSEKQSGNGAILRNVQVKINEQVSVADFNIFPDNTDSTAKFSTMLATLSAAGGAKIWFPPGTFGKFYKLGCIVFPNNGATPTPSQSTFILEGAGAAQNHPQSAPIYPTSGSIIVNTCASATSALFDTRGNGYLEIHGLNIINPAGSDVSLAVHTTNTVVNIHDNLFAGRVLSGVTPAQDQIALGDESITQSGNFDAPFQGYYSTVERNYFMYTRQAVTCNAFCNGVLINANSGAFGNGADSSHGFINIVGSSNGTGVAAQGNIITNNLIEAGGAGSIAYVYAIRITKGLNSYISGNGCYDSNPSVVGACIYLGSGISSNPGTLNFVILNLPTVANGSWLPFLDAGANTVMVTGTYGLVSAGGGHDIGVDATTGDATISTYLAGVRKWSWYNIGTNNKFNLYDWTCSCFRYTATASSTGTHTFFGSALISDAPTGDATLSTSIAGTVKWGLYDTAATGHLGIYDFVNSNFALDFQANAGTATFNGSELIKNAASGDSYISTAIAGTHKWAFYNTAISGNWGLWNWTNSLFAITANPAGAVTFPVAPTTFGAGGNTVYRCATAGATLPVGSLTVNAAACGSTADTGLRVP